METLTTLYPLIVTGDDYMDESLDEHFVISGKSAEEYETMELSWFTLQLDVFHVYVQTVFCLWLITGCFTLN